MNDFFKYAHKNFCVSDDVRVHSARCTQCIHVGSHKLKLPKTFIPIKNTTAPPPFPPSPPHLRLRIHPRKVQLYIAVRYIIYTHRVEKINSIYELYSPPPPPPHTHTHIHTRARAHSTLNSIRTKVGLREDQRIEVAALFLQQNHSLSEL